MATDIELQEVRTRRDLEAFIRFPWRVYRGDHNWVPPLLAERRDYFSPGKNPALRGAELALFLARRRGDVVGTVAALADRRDGAQADDRAGVFGFFEVLEDYEAARTLLDGARAWLRRRGVSRLQGPYNLSQLECPGVLIEGADCPPVMLTGHTPLYYGPFLERYGMEVRDNLYAWRAFRHQIGEQLEKVPEEVVRAAQVAARHGVTVRKLRLERWGEEVSTACHIFNATLAHLPQRVPVTEAEFRRFADPMRRIVDPDLALFAEHEGRVVGFCVSLPDINRALIHLDGRLYPLGWLRLWWQIRRIDVLTFKLMGVLPEFRFRGIDALLFVGSLRAMMAKGYQWLDGSLTSERNPMINLLAGRLGAQRYKHYRVYQMDV
jgi:hypothetical protein